MADLGRGLDTYSVTVALVGIEDVDAALEEAVYGGECGDALLFRRDGVVQIVFERQATSLQEAVASVVVDLAGSGFRCEDPDRCMDEIAKSNCRKLEVSLRVFGVRPLDL